MKLGIIVLLIILCTYFGIDHWLSTTFASSPQNQELVQSMATFLEANPNIQRKLASVDNPTEATEKDPVAPTSIISPAVQYLGDSQSDIFFKSILNKSAALSEEDSDGQLNQTMEMLEFIKENPKESIKTLEQALATVPVDMEKERTVLSTAYIHASIQSIEQIDADQSEEKLYQLNRFIKNGNDPKIKETLENHFANLISGSPNPEPARVEIKTDEENNHSAAESTEESFNSEAVINQEKD